jgi:hypothetical protein
MKKWLSLLVLVATQWCYAQENNKISVEFNAVSRKNAVLKIEQLSGYRFYFDEQWLDADKSLISGNYTNVTLPSLLESVFNNTPINFFIDGKKVILTNNNLIYSKLPDDFFGKSTTVTTDDETDKPVFYQQFDSVSASRRNTTITLVGKQTQKTEKTIHAFRDHQK